MPALGTRLTARRCEPKSDKLFRFVSDRLSDRLTSTQRVRRQSHPAHNMQRVAGCVMSHQSPNGPSAGSGEPIPNKALFDDQRMAPRRPC